MRGLRKCGSPGWGWCEDPPTNGRFPYSLMSLSGQYLHHVTICRNFKLLICEVLSVVMYRTVAAAASPRMSNRRPVKHGQNISIRFSSSPYRRLRKNRVCAALPPQTSGAALVSPLCLPLVFGTPCALLSHDFTQHAAQRLMNSL